MFEDLCWFGFRWHEGPDVGGPFGPYSQSERMDSYRAAFERLKQSGYLYPCSCSRQDVLRAVQAPHQGEDEPLYPGTCRPKPDGETSLHGTRLQLESNPETRVNWRFRAPEGEIICFEDHQFGPQRFVAGVDFGDFVVWRHDDVPAYHLAVVVDDAAMQITEVVRGADLLKSTARQLLLYQALDWKPPAFCHCPLVTDPSGIRLAKRHDALSLRALRTSGADPVTLRAAWQSEEPKSP
jgi:glutamyl-tRNA synthetase